MSALREQIVAAVVSALNAGAPAGTPTAERWRTDALNREALDALIVYPLRDEAEDIGGKRGPIRARSLEITVECWAAETASASADQVATTYCEWVTAALEDNLLGGLVNGLRERDTDYVVEVGEIAYCLATVTMVAEYQHRAGDLTLKT